VFGELYCLFSCSLFFRFREPWLERLLTTDHLLLIVRLYILRKLLYKLLLVPSLFPLFAPNIWSEAT
jgi:hypothetical protein